MAGKVGLVHSGRAGWGGVIGIREAQSVAIMLFVINAGAGRPPRVAAHDEVQWDTRGRANWEKGRQMM
jgi:hypothetical protein